MSAREIRLERLVGRRVRDARGRPCGRIEELICEIELREHGSDYVVRGFRVGSFGALDALSRSAVLRGLLQTLLRGAGYRWYEIPWQWMDLSDPARPRIDRDGKALVTKRPGDA